MVVLLWIPAGKKYAENATGNVSIIVQNSFSQNATENITTIVEKSPLEISTENTLRIVQKGTHPKQIKKLKLE